MADAVAEKMSQASATRTTAPPKKGERFRCARCGMEVQVTTGCSCKGADHSHFECCGQEMLKA
jgi:hypothetical protein